VGSNVVNCVFAGDVLSAASVDLLRGEELAARTKDLSGKPSPNVAMVSQRPIGSSTKYALLRSRAASTDSIRCTLRWRRAGARCGVCPAGHQ
jgi:hypothetical protein